MSLRSTLSKLPDPVKELVKGRLYPKLLAEGETAPEWHLQAHDDSWHRQGKHWSVLFFYEDDHAERDRAQLSALQANFEAFKALGVKVFAVNPAETWPHADLAKELGLAYPILTDRGGSVARLFRACVQLPFQPLLIDTVYLVNPERKIRLANRGTPSIEAIVRSIEALQKATKAGM